MGCGDTTQQLKALAIFAEDLSSVSSILIGLHITTCDSSYNSSDALFWPSSALYSCAQSHKDTHLHINKAYKILQQINKYVISHKIKTRIT